MSRIILLDSGPLGLVSNPNATPQAIECRRWLAGLVARGVQVTIPCIADYEVRRELLRARKQRGLAELDRLKMALRYIPWSEEIAQKAAELWARARQQGTQTAPDPALDGDMFLAAQAVLLADAGNAVTIATTNTKHLALFADAQAWAVVT